MPTIGKVQIERVHASPAKSLKDFLLVAVAVELLLLPCGEALGWAGGGREGGRKGGTLLGDRALAEVYLEPCTVQNHNRTVLDRLRGRVAPLDTLSRLDHYLRLFLGQLVILGDVEILLGHEAPTDRAVRHGGHTVVPPTLRVPSWRCQNF